MKAKFNLKQIAKKNRFRRKKLKPIQSSEFLEAEYYKYLRALVNSIKSKFVKTVVSGMKADKNKWQDESYSAKMNRLINQVVSETESKYGEKTLTEIAKTMIFKVDKYQKIKFKRSAELGFGFDISQLPDFIGYRQFINASIQKNLAEIKNLRTETMYKLEMSLRTAIEKGTSISQLTNELMSTNQHTRQRAALIARNEIKNLTSQLNQRRAVNAAFEVYAWQNAGDQRVRGNPNGWYPKAKPSHWIMEGLYCRYDNDTVYSADKGKTWKKRTSKMPKGKPGEEINCRCLALPVD